MDSCQLITNILAKNVLCHFAEVVKNLQPQIVFSTMWLEVEKILCQKQSMLMKPEESAKHQQTLQVGSEHVQRRGIAREEGGEGV